MREAMPGLVTIGITCYNAADTIERALNSAFRQDWPNFEVVIVDDCSSDNSVRVIERLIAGRDNARLIRHPINTGPAGARNTIIAEARGEFIAFFDDDDEALPQRLSTQVQRLEAYERSSGARLVACHASGWRRYSSGYVMDLAAIGSRGGGAPHGPRVAEALLLFRREPNWFYGAGTPACSLLARASTFAAVGHFDQNLRRVEDVDFAIRLALIGGHFIGTPEPLFIQYSTSAPDKSPEKNLKAEQALAIKHRDFLESVRGYQYALNWPKLRYWHFRRRYGRLLLEFLALLMRHPVSATRHIMTTGPRRLLHERCIRQGGKA